MNGFSNSASSGSTPDPFTSFWVDMMSRMSGATPTQSAPLREDVMRQMRQAMFDVWGKQAEEFMRSDVFLDAMKRSMDSSLAIKQQFNDFMTRALHESQAPARKDIDSIILLLRSLEERMQKRLNDLSARMETLSTALSPKASSPQPSAPPRTKGGSR